MSSLLPLFAGFAFLFILGALVLVIVFNLSMQRAMRTVREGNRKLKPGLIWLNLIPVPIFNSIWTPYFCYTLCESMDKDAGRPISPKRLTNFYLGLSVINVVLSFSTYDFSYTVDSFSYSSSSSGSFGTLDIVMLVLGIVGFVMFIVMWVQINNARKQLERMNREGGVGGADDLLDQPL